MIRGVNKCIVEVMDTENKYFDRAILFLNRNFVGTSKSKIELEAKKYLSTVNVSQKNVGFLRQKKKKSENVKKCLIMLSVVLVLSIILALVIKF